MKSLRRSLRRARFYILEKLLLPLAIVPLRMLVRSWRAMGPDERILREAVATRPLILATYHGMFLHLLAFSGLAAPFGRRLVVLITPSLDGRLLGSMLRYFGIDHIMAQPGNRSVPAAREFIRRIQEGWIGVIAADGPRGPVAVAQPFVLELARSAGAGIVLAATSARPGITFRSWDRSCLPLPFAAVRLRLTRFTGIGCDYEGIDASALQEALSREARAIASPVVRD